jgi:hypothetical protein
VGFAPKRKHTRLVGERTGGYSFDIRKPGDEIAQKAWSEQEGLSLPETTAIPENA